MRIPDTNASPFGVSEPPDPLHPFGCRSLDPSLSCSGLLVGVSISQEDQEALKGQVVSAVPCDGRRPTLAPAALASECGGPGTAHIACTKIGSRTSHISHATFALARRVEMVLGASCMVVSWPAEMVASMVASCFMEVMEEVARLR